MNNATMTPARISLLVPRTPPAERPSTYAPATATAAPANAATGNSRAMKAHRAEPPRDRTAECGNAFAQMVVAVFSPAPSASPSNLERSFAAKADRQAGQMQPSAAARISASVSRRRTTASHQQPGWPWAHPNGFPQSGQIFAIRLDVCWANLAIARQPRPHAVDPSSAFTAPAIAFRNRTMRGPHCDAIESSTGTTDRVLTALMALQPGLVATVAMLCPQQAGSANATTSGSLEIIASADCGG